MKYLLKRFQPILFTAILTLFGLTGSDVSGSTFVRMDFNLFLQTRFQSTAFIELFDDRPITTTNFLKYVDGGDYDNTVMHRLVHGFVLQGGGFYEDFIPWPAPLNVAMDEDPVDLDGNPATNNPTIQNEFGNSPFRSNLIGTLAMAKTAAGPNSATNQFFFNLANNSSNLDNQNGGFTVFAQVVGNGMNLIGALGNLQVTNLNKDIYTQVTTPGASYGQITGVGADGVRDFAGTGIFEEMPFLGSNLLRLERTSRTDYFSSTSTTNVTSSNLTFTNSLAHIEAGATFTGTGKIIVGAGKTLSASHGANIGRPLEVAGTFSPGLAVGDVTVSSYTQLASGTLDLQIGGVTVGTQYDQIDITAAATLSGTLRVSTLSTFSPSAGDAFTILNAGSISGGFTSATFPTLRDGLAWDLQVSANNIKLVVLPDYNENGTVDLADLTLWQSNYGSTTALAADGNGNGTVDGQDFLLWQRYFGQTVTLPPPATIKSIPEPNSLALISLALAGFTLQRIRSYRTIQSFNVE